MDIAIQKCFGGKLMKSLRDDNLFDYNTYYYWDLEEGIGTNSIEGYHDDVTYNGQYNVDGLTSLIISSYNSSDFNLKNNHKLISIKNVTTTK